MRNWPARIGFLELMSLNTFQALVALQDRDKMLVDLRKSYVQIDEEIRRKRNQVESLRADRDAARRAHTEAELRLRRLELDRAEENQKLVSTRDQYDFGDHAMSSRETDALERSIQDSEENIARMDKDIAPAQEQADMASDRLKSVESRLVEVEAELAEKKVSGKEEQARLAEQHNEKLEEKKRMVAESDIPPDQLAKYKRLFEANDGEAVASVEREVCGGCSERLPTGMLNELKEAEEPILCHCGRYLITLNAR